MDPRGQSRQGWIESPLLALALALVPACGGSASEVQAGEGPPRPSVVVILLDALRADHLGCYGYDRPTSPRIDAFARESVLFENTLAQSTWTKPSTATVLTGLYPSHHGATTPYIRLAEGHETLAELLAHEGYSTAAFGFNPHVFGDTGFDQGFEVFQTPPNESDHLGYPRGAAIVDRALEWLAETGKGGAAGEQPFFLYVHLFDTHAPYDPVEPYRARFDRGVHGEHDAWYMLRMDVDPADLSEADWSHYVDLYDGEVAYADAQVGRLLDALDLDRTAVILLADHGEELSDHGGWSHDPTLHAELLHVPMIASFPALRAGGFQGARIQELAQQIDVVPTVLDLLGLPERTSLPGRSLCMKARGDGQPALAGFSEVDIFGSFKKSVVEGGAKYIHSWSPEAREELYDLAQDPGEHQDLLAQRPEQAARLRALLEAHVREAPARFAFVAENRSQETVHLTGFLVTENERVSGSDLIDCEFDVEGAPDFDGPFLFVDPEAGGRVMKAVQFTLRTRPGDSDGFYFTPPDGETRLEVHLRVGDDIVPPGEVFLGAAREHPGSTDPIVLDLTDPERYASAVRPPASSEEPYALYFWRTLDAALAEEDLPPGTRDALQRLGYTGDR